jgi:hypothetical protein
LTAGKNAKTMFAGGQPEFFIKTGVSSAVLSPWRRFGADNRMTAPKRSVKCCEAQSGDENAGYSTS